MTVYDKWHKTHPLAAEVRCSDHRKVPTAGHGRGKRWQVRYRDEAGAQRSQNFDRQGDAQQFDAKVQRELATAGYIDPSAGKVTVADYALGRWLPAQLHLRPNSAETYRLHLRTHIVPAIGKRPLSSLRRRDMESLVAALSASLAPSTTGTVFSVLRAMLGAAADDRLIAVNPCQRVRLPRVEKRVVVPLPRDHVLALVRAMPGRYRLAVVLAAMAGLREGEALGLTVPCVDFLRRRIKVQRQSQGRELAPLKTRASMRTVPADDMVLTEITEHMRAFPPGDHQVIITAPGGRPPGRSAFGDAWRGAVAAAPRVPKGTHFHDLRHFYASVLIAANLNPKVIQSRLGHATISETMDTYGHLFPDSEELGRGTFDTLFRDADVHGLCTGKTGS